jgi:hypothetical protein
MRAVQRRQITRLVIAFWVGVLLGKVTTTASGSSDPEDRQPGVTREDSVSSLWHQRPASFAARYSPGFSLLQPTRISLQAPLGGWYADRLVADADPTGSIAAGDIADNSSTDSAGSSAVDRELKGDRLAVGAFAPPQAAHVAEIPSAPSAVAAPAPQAAKPVIIAKPLKPLSIAPLVKDAHRATPSIQLAYAAAPSAEDLAGSGIGRPREADLAPPIIIGHTREDHEGGDVDVFAAKYEQIRESGRKVEIDGPCVSACTIVASLPKGQVCVTPRAALGVHLASDGDDQVDVQYTDWAVKKYYPKALQDWIKTHGGLQEVPKFVKGNDLLTIFNACKKGT